MKNDEFRRYVFAIIPPDERWITKGWEWSLKREKERRGWWAEDLIRKELERRGHTFNLISEYDISEWDKIDFFIFYNVYHFSYQYYKKIIEKNMDYKMVYYMVEPKAVMSWHSANKINTMLTFFPAIITWRPDIYEHAGCYEGGLVSLPDCVIENSKVSFQEKKLLTMISVYSHSSDPDELYSERKRLALWYEKNHPEDFDLFGRGWPDHPCYHGECGNKKEVYHNYKFAIAMENSVCEGYFEEKMISCWQSGIVPIYKGARDIHELVPYKCFIDYDEYIGEGGEERLYDYLVSMTENEYKDYLSEAEKAMKLEMIKTKTPNFFCQQLLKMADDRKDKVSFRVGVKEKIMARLYYFKASLLQWGIDHIWIPFLRPIVRG